MNEPQAAQPHVVNGRLIASVLAFAEMKLGRETALATFDRALEGSGVTHAQAVDSRGWVPLDVLERVGDAFEPRLGESFITDSFTWAVPRRIDFSAMSLSAVANPAFLMRQLDRAGTFYARHVRYVPEILGPGHARIKLVYAEGQPRRKHSCRIGQGVVSGVPMIFDLPPAEITETACYADGADACVYDVRWRTEPPYAWLGLFAGLAVAGVGALLAPALAWLAAPVAGWLAGRELRLHRLRHYMTRVSEEHRRALGENERDFARRYDEIKELNDKLELRVAERTKELTEAMTALREGNADLRRTIEEMRTISGNVVDAGVRSMLGRAVEEFAHELNNPLTTVLANMQFLEDPQSRNSDVSELGNVAQDIRDAVYRMKAVIGWFIEIYETDREPTICQLHEHVRQMVEAVGRQWRGRVTIDAELDELTVSARGMQLMQVFENLLANAGQAEGVRNVKVRGTRAGGIAKLVVSDDGIGIRPDILPRIFDRGFTTKRGRGSGLGLYISRAIIERHGGTLTATSEVGKGARFELTLPLYDAGKQSEPRARMSSRPAPDERSA